MNQNKLNSGQIHSYSDVIKMGVDEWLVDNLWRFDLFIFEEEPREARITALSEFSILCSLLSKCVNMNEIQKMLYNSGIETIYNVFKNPSFKHFVFHCPPEAFIAILILWSSLPPMKRAQVLSQKDLEKLIDSKRILSNKRSPMQMLELSYFLDSIGYKNNLPTRHQIYKQAILNNKNDFSLNSVSDIYNFTHIVFYVTNFGFGKKVLKENDYKYLIKINNFYLQPMIKIKHIDLICELLFVHKLLGAVESNLTNKGWLILKEELLEKKLLTNIESKIFLKAKNINYKDDDDAMFLTHYHIYLVAAMATIHPC